MQIITICPVKSLLRTQIERARSASGCISNAYVSKYARICARMLTNRHNTVIIMITEC